MILVPIASFFSGFALVALYLGFRVFEHSRGTMLFKKKRGELDTQIEHLYHALVMGSIPIEWRFQFISLLHTLSRRSVQIAVEILRAIERPLARLSYRMRTYAPKANGKEVSAYLKTIIIDKKNSTGKNGTTPEGGV